MSGPTAKPVRSSPAKAKCGKSSRSRIGKIAGCYVRNGTITRGSKVRFLRDGVVIWNGEIASLKRFKDDVREVQSGYECGIGLENYQDLKPVDVIETFSVKELDPDARRVQGYFESRSRVTHSLMAEYTGLVKEPTVPANLFSDCRSHEIRVG
jgi:hypothetical protein